MKHLFLILFSLSCTVGLMAQGNAAGSNKSDSVKNAFRVISEKEKPGGAGVTFHQDKRIEKAVISATESTGSVIP